MQFVQTDMGLKMDPKIIDIVGGFIPIEMVIKGIFLPKIFCDGKHCSLMIYGGLTIF